MSGHMGGHVCVDCGEPAVVGWGRKPDWVCMVHYEERLQKSMAALRHGLQSMNDE